MKNQSVTTIFKRTAFVIVFFFLALQGYSQKAKSGTKEAHSTPKLQRIFYGKASYYSNIFQGKRTANGEIFSQDKYTAACNVLPLGTWIRVTNLKNGKSVKVKTTDRLHTRMRRLVDLSRVAAKKLGYLDAGLARVKVEVLYQKKKSK